MTPNDIVLCLHPRRLTVGEVKQHLKKRDEESRKILADLIQHRLEGRYITPLEKTPVKYKSGFLTMAACCLMIETFQCFKEGKKDTKARGEGKAAFKKFFSHYETSFPEIDGEEFYEKIRCGILHQAQTQGRFRILRKGAVFNSALKTINATAFLKILKRIVSDYVEELRTKDLSAAPWPNALRKIKFICDAVENE